MFEWAELFYYHCMFCPGCWQENNVCFHPSSPRAEIRLHSEEWVRSALRSLFFPPQHNFPPVNWSVFASLSTPAKQHFPWSYRISIRSFPSNVALSQLQCFCSYMAASLWSLLSVLSVCRCFGETWLAFLWRCLCEFSTLLCVVKQLTFAGINAALVNSSSPWCSEQFRVMLYKKKKVSHFLMFM